MKRHAAPTQPMTALFSISCFVVALTLAGCNADTLSGPELDSTDAISLQAPAQAASGQHEGHNECTGGCGKASGQHEGHNEGTGGNKNGKHEGHNEGTGDDNAITSGQHEGHNENPPPTTQHEGHNECTGGCDGD